MPHLRTRPRVDFAIFHHNDDESGFYLPAKSWLNEEMRENKDLLPKEAAEMTELFGKDVKIIRRHLWRPRFRPAKYPDGSKKGKKVTAEDVTAYSFANTLIRRDFRRFVGHYQQPFAKMAQEK